MKFDTINLGLTGYDDLFMSSEERADKKPKVEEISISELRPFKDHPFRVKEDEEMEQLKKSIHESGVLVPALARPTEDGYELIAGARRLAACRLLGHREIPCIVVQAGDEKSALLSLAENLHRKDLHYLDEAERLKALLDRGTLTEEQLLTRIGKSEPYLDNRLRLLNLSTAVRARLRSANLSERHARALLRLNDGERQKQALDVIERRHMNAPAAERLVDSMTNTAGAAPMRILRFSRDCRLFVNSVKTCIEQLEGSGITAAMEETRRDDGVDLIIRVRT